MNENYVINLIKLFSDNKYNDNLNNFINDKEILLFKYKKIKNIFKNFLFFAYFLTIILCFINFIDNFFIGEKLDYWESIFLFFSFISILIYFVINDFFNYFLNNIYNKKFMNLKIKVINEKDFFIKNIIEDINFLDHFNIETKIEEKLQFIQDNDPELLKKVYSKYSFNNKESKSYIQFFIAQSSSIMDI
jgi:hypothetical protein